METSEDFVEFWVLIDEVRHWNVKLFGKNLNDGQLIRPATPLEVTVYGPWRQVAAISDVDLLYAPGNHELFDFVIPFHSRILPATWLAYHTQKGNYGLTIIFHYGNLVATMEGEMDLLTDTQIAEKLSVNPSTVFRWRRQIRGISPDMAVALEKATGINRLAWLYPKEYPNPYIPYACESRAITA